MKFSSIKTQLTAIYTTLIIFLVICVSILAEFLSSNALINRSVLSANRELRLLSEKLELFVENTEGFSLYLLQVQNDDSFNEPSKSFQYTSGVLSFLQDFVFTHPLIESISFYDAQGSVLFSDTKSNFVELPNHKIQYIEDFKKEEHNTKWTDFHYFEYPSKSKSPKWGCSFLRKVYSYSGEFLGIFELNISEESIQSIYDIALADHYNFYILDHTDTVVSSKNKSVLHLSFKELEKKYPKETISHLFHSSNNYLYSTYTNDKLGWTFVSTLPLQEVLKEPKKLVLSIFGIGFLSIILALLLLNRLTKSITGPLVNLTKTVEKIADGNYKIKADTNTPNEIGLLAKQINTMSTNTLCLLDRIEQESTLKRQFELSYIQLQMTPHFLYNTLESICGMIAVDEKKKAIKMIQNLSVFYRKILTRGTPIVSLKQELEITRCYLDILRQRYCEIYSYEFLLDPQVETYSIPKLTFQPFVENALIHGILPTGKPGHLILSIVYEKMKLNITIEDNGQGMKQEVLENLELLLKEKSCLQKKELGFGIVGTYQRLSLFLNDPDIEMHIHSLPGKGTKINLILPAQQAEALQKERDHSYV